MMLSQTTEYAIRALIYLANHNQNGPILSKDIAEKVQVPANYLSKILNNLARAGYVEGTRGIKGGFRLAIDPNSLKIHDIVSLFDSTADRNICFLGQKGCSIEPTCSAHNKWKPVADNYYKFLEETSLKDLLG